ncbi:hypothetical protein FACS189432_06840 [Bacteroidia bacterium]|nr:hypothetical protein FACS189426_10420 [Bacteroidia bacterium]GHT28641.1 hypothetical protein FACS189432_06840 [Bacteroidia bacterium]
MEGAVKNNKHNYPYAAGKALLLAEIYMMKNKLSAVKHYAGKAREWLDTERDVSRAQHWALAKILSNAIAVLPRKGRQRQLHHYPTHLSFLSLPINENDWA